MNFFQTIMGQKFYNHDVPKLINAIEGLTRAVEKSTAKADEEVQAAILAAREESFYFNKMFSKIMDFAKTEDFSCEVVPKQLHSLWVAYCIYADYEVDTSPYDIDLLEIWNNALSKNPTNTFSDFEAFDMYMCEDLV